MRHLLTAALALTLAAGCGSSDSTGPTASLVGSYQLQTVNGAPLPYTDGTGNQLVSSTLQVNGDGTYTAAAQSIPAGGGTRTDSVTSNWSGNSSAVRFANWFDGTTPQGSLSGSVLSINDAGATGAYQKQ